MNIKEFSRKCGLSAHTLRYYEKIGLLPAVERTESNHRRYSERDVVWITFIKRLKATNMPLVEILRYAELREQGKGTEEARMHLLIAHARRLEQTIEHEQEHLERLKEKIRCYQEVICR
jgi:DNA-binding transcriptional MerR regulator